MADLTLVGLYGACLLGQSLALCRVAGLPAEVGAGIVAGAAALVAVVPVFARRLAPCQSMGFAMLAVGGLGMTLGWWIDLGCPAAGPPAPCHTAASGPHLHVVSWMNGGMLLLGLPAMALAMAREHGFAWRSWGGGGLLVLSAPAMVAGMLAGSLAAYGLVDPLGLPPSGARLLDWAAMNAGMLGAMPPAHALATRFARRRRARAGATRISAAA